MVRFGLSSALSRPMGPSAAARIFRTQDWYFLVLDREPPPPFRRARRIQSLSDEPRMPRPRALLRRWVQPPPLLQYSRPLGVERRLRPEGHQIRPPKLRGSKCHL